MKPPSVIYLQFFDSEDGTALDPSRWDEITWCRDRISKYDLVYDLRLKTNNDPLLDSFPLQELFQSASIKNT